MPKSKDFFTLKKKYTIFPSKPGLNDMQSKQYFSLEPARFKLDGGAMFGIIPKPLWNKVHPADEHNRIELALRLILIKDGSRNILIDTGIGDYHGEKWESRFGVVGEKSPLELSLAEIGMKPEEITDLIISHLHFDHVGGIGKMVDGKIEPVLKNATVHLHKKHFEYSKNPTVRDEGSFQIEYFLPVIKWYEDNNKIHFIDGMEGDVLPGIKFKCSMGHTPYLLHAYDEKMIYMADLIPTSNHVHIPWVMGYDISPGVTTVDKKNFLEFIESKHLTMIFEHDPIFFGSTVKKNEKGDFVCDKKMSYEAKPAYPIF
jgi:glyoxylase-like metal-dependent hydrolase (beta-lactamase superfamily II)